MASPRVPREFSKKAIVRDLLVRTGGATLQEIMEKTGWQKHTVRGFISTLAKKTGIAITSTRRESDGARVYGAAKWRQTVTASAARIASGGFCRSWQVKATFRYRFATISREGHPTANVEPVAHLI